jgi:hypothetical protein
MHYPPSPFDEWALIVKSLYETIETGETGEIYLIVK